MAFNGSGVYTAPTNSFAQAVTGTAIDSANWNATRADLESALSNVICKDGQTTVTANLPMATYRHTGVSNATALTQYATADQVVDNALCYGGASAAGTDTYAVNLAISPGAYAAGQRYSFIADVANTGACTINFSSIGAASIKLQDGSDPYNSAIIAGQIVEVEYDGTNMVLLNPIDRNDPSLAEINDTNGNESLILTATASAVNELTVANAATGNKPSINQTGADDVGIDIEGVELHNGVVTAALTGNVTGNVLSDYVKLTDTKAAGTNGGTFTSGSWQTRVINTEDTDTANICTLSSNQFTLDAGTYYIKALACANYVGTNKIRLQNTTSATTLIEGLNCNTNITDGGDQNYAGLYGRFTVAAAQALEIQHQCLVTKATNGYGVATSIGSTEQYLQVELWKLN